MYFKFLQRKLERQSADLENDTGIIFLSTEDEDLMEFVLLMEREADIENKLDLLGSGEKTYEELLPLDEVKRSRRVCYLCLRRGILSWENH